MRRVTSRRRRAAFQAADEGDISVPAFNSADLMRAVFKLVGLSRRLSLARPVEKGIINHLTDADASLVSSERPRRAGSGSRSCSSSPTWRRPCWCWWAPSGWAWPRPMRSGLVGRLVQAAGRVAGGDLTARVDAENDPDEIAVLSRAFNSMTHDLQAQQTALQRARDEADQDRQFIETMLAEVSAGVIGLDPDGGISAANRQAIELLGLDVSPVGGHQTGRCRPGVRADRRARPARGGGKKRSMSTGTRNSAVAGPRQPQRRRTCAHLR